MKEYQESNLEIEGLDWMELSKYIAMNTDEGEVWKYGLSRIIARRTYKMARKWGMKARESLLGKKQEEIKAAHWEVPKVYPPSR